jgi:1,4-alpha-glucan branching enzyme
MAASGKIDAEAIVTAAHPDPTSVLGPHVDGDGLRIVAFLPSAERVIVQPTAGDRAARPMSKIHEAGLFEIHYAGVDAPFPYCLRITTITGETRDMADPYAYPPLLGELDLFLLGEGTQLESYTLLGAHVREMRGVRGVHFAVWAPHARWVSVIGDFNDWDGRRHPMRRRNEGGIWELFIPDLGTGAHYKYHIRSEYAGYMVDKADPYAFYAEVRPRTASIVTELSGYSWGDADWLERRAQTDPLRGPMLIYEVHLGSWRRHADGSFLGYRELAHQLVDYVREMGFTHIELLPITEHPTDVSWGYQTTGYYAPTSRFGTPHDFMYFVDYCHQHGIGVFLDWVPSHFAKEGHGLGFFDGAHEYEHADPRQGESEWGSYVFNYGRGEVRGFLVSNALFWLSHYHLDGFRVDAVASMIHLDFLRPPGTWVPNKYGGSENLDAIAFLRRFNELVHERFPGAVTMAEESTSWPMISRPVYLGGLGFTMKWNMGWMHDVLEYFKYDPVFRRYIHNTMTFSMMYHYSENFLLPLSHDEVVHGKSPLVYKAPGDEWQKFASLRLLLGYMWAHPGKKLLFMGGEFGQTSEWNYAAQLRWDLLPYEPHRGVHHWMRDLNALYLSRSELYALDYDYAGFQWIDCNDVDQSVLIMMRRGAPRPERLGDLDLAWIEEQEDADSPDLEAVSARPRDAARQREERAEAVRRKALDRTRPFLIFACNFTPVVRHGYRIGVPVPGVYRERLCSDDHQYGGSGVINEGDFFAHSAPMQGWDHSILCTLPPLAVSIFEIASRPGHEVRERSLG